MPHIDRPSSAEYDILSAEEETPEQLGARLHLMSDDTGDHPVMIALPPRGRSPPATAIFKEDRWVFGTHLSSPIKSGKITIGFF